jgi:peptidoglycan/LPS O-acetylase OafA/YrhL
MPQPGGMLHNRGLRHYIPTLDGWRAVAIAMVLFCHARLPHDFLAGVSPYGALGVDLFFAISGFLITSRLIEESRTQGSISLKAFYARRFFRIIPPAFAYLACAAVLGLVLRWIPMNAGQLAASAGFYRNYYSMGVEHSWYTGHFWSLAVEEHFYLLWPAILVWFGIKRGGTLAPALACGVAIWRGLDSHFAWVAKFAPQLKDSVARTDYRLDGLLWGCALAFVLQSERGRAGIGKLCAPWSLAVLIPGIVLLAWAHPPGGSALLAILFPLCLCCTVIHPESRIARLLEARPIAWFGRLSYSLYLWQQLFFPAREVPAPLGVLQMFPLNLAVAVIAAVISFHFVERPMIAAGRRLCRCLPPPVSADEEKIEHYEAVA